MVTLSRLYDSKICVTGTSLTTSAPYGRDPRAASYVRPLSVSAKAPSSLHTSSFAWTATVLTTAEADHGLNGSAPISGACVRALHTRMAVVIFLPVISAMLYCVNSFLPLRIHSLFCCARPSGPGELVVTSERACSSAVGSTSSVTHEIIGSSARAQNAATCFATHRRSSLLYLQHDEHDAFAAPATAQYASCPADGWWICIPNECPRCMFLCIVALRASRSPVLASHDVGVAADLSEPV